VTTAQDGGRLSALLTGRLYPQEILLVLISVRGRVDPRAIVDRKEFMSMKNTMTPAGIEPATSRFVTQHLNHCATAVNWRYMLLFDNGKHKTNFTLSRKCWEFREGSEAYCCIQCRRNMKKRKKCRGKLTLHDYIYPSTSTFIFLSRALIEYITHLLVHTSLHLLTYTRIKTTNERTNERTKHPQTWCCWHIPSVTVRRFLILQ